MKLWIARVLIRTATASLHVSGRLLAGTSAQSRAYTERELIDACVAQWAVGYDRGLRDGRGDVQAQVLPDVARVWN